MMKAYRTKTNSLIIFYRNYSIGFGGEALLRRSGIEQNFENFIKNPGPPSKAYPNRGPFKEVKLSTVFLEE